MSIATLLNGYKLPILFIGSGLSKRYINSPDWQGLLQQIYSYMGKNKNDYNKLKSKIKNTVDSRNLSVGELNALIAKELENLFNNHFFNSKLVDKHPEWLKDGHSPFKLCVASIFKGNTIIPSMKDEVDWLKKLRGKLHSIITTNYDTFIKNIFEFKDESIFIGQHQLFNSLSVEIDEMYKLHGCITQPEYITITSEDYEHYKENAKLFSAKLLTLISENPVIFLGYSIEDPNVQDTLSNLVSCLTEDQIEQLESHFYIVEYKQGEEELIEKQYMFPAESYDGTKVTFPVTVITTDNYQELYKQLSNLMPAMNITAVKQVKRIVKDIVIESSKSIPIDEPIITIMMEDLNQLSTQSDNKMAIAVGKVDTINDYGYGIKPKIEIFEDVLLDNKNLDSTRLLKGTYERHYLKIKQNIPIFKYSTRVRQSVIDESPLVNAYLKEKRSLNSYLNKTLLKEVQRVPEGSTLKDLPIDYTANRRRKYLWIFKNIENIEIEEIQDFLVEELPKYESFDGNNKGYYNRLISMYDLLKYKLKK